jgi:flagellar P-ring protein precursor FlgI
MHPVSMLPACARCLPPAAGAACCWHWPRLKPPCQAARIKEVAPFEGVRTNQLTGFGLVVGLDGTGDQTTQMPYTSQGMTNYLQQLGITLPAASCRQLQLKNVAAVLVTAQLPAFAPSRGRPLTSMCLRWATPSRSRAAC